MFEINEELLQRCSSPLTEVTPADCRALVSDFGELGRWVLCDEVLSRAAASWELRSNPAEATSLRARPDLPRTAGSCWVLFAADTVRFPLLRDGFPVPLHWRRRLKDQTQETDPHTRLPQQLRDEAKSVLEVMHKSKTTGDPSQPDDWRLELALEDADLYDLSGLNDISTNSGWAALASGWLVATRSGRVDTKVWASACGGENGLIHVDPRTIQAKMRAAAFWGASTFAVADTQRQHNPNLADLAAMFQLELLELPSNQPNPVTALKPLARRLAVCPDRPMVDLRTWPAMERQQFFQDATGYYYLVKTDLADPRGATAFYREVPLPIIMEECRLHVERKAPGLIERCNLLVTVLSGGADLIELAVGVLQPKRCLVLYTEQTKGQLAETELRVKGVAPSCELKSQPIGRDMRPGGLPQLVHDWVEPRPAETVLDLTPGTKIMTLTLDRDLPPACARLYFMTEQKGGQEIDLGTYDPLLL